MAFRPPAGTLGSNNQFEYLGNIESGEPRGCGGRDAPTVKRTEGGVHQAAHGALRFHSPILHSLICGPSPGAIVISDAYFENPKAPASLGVSP